MPYVIYNISITKFLKKKVWVWWWRICSLTAFWVRVKLMNVPQNVLITRNTASYRVCISNTSALDFPRHGYTMVCSQDKLLLAVAMHSRFSSLNQPGPLEPFFRHVVNFGRFSWRTALWEMELFCLFCFTGNLHPGNICQWIIYTFVSHLNIKGTNVLRKKFINPNFFLFVVIGNKTKQNQKLKEDTVNSYLIQLKM